MAILSNINGKFAVDSTGAIQFSGAAGTSGYILESAGVGASPTWIPKSDIVGAYLPLAGGTLTGATATASGIAFTVGGTLTVNGIGTFNTPAGGVAFNLDAAADNYGTFRLRTNGNVNKWDVGMKNDNDFYIYNQATSAQAFELDTANNNATFAGNVFARRGSFGTASNFNFDLYCNGNAYINDELTVDDNATFAGTITSSGAGSAGRITGAQGIFGTTFALTSNGYATFGSTSSSVPIALSIDGDGANPAFLIDTDDRSKFFGDVEFDKNVWQDIGTNGGYIMRPHGADYITQTGSVTGAIEIRIPTGGAQRDDMLKFVVDIYDYATSESVTVFIGGYIYQAIGGNTWIAPSAQVIASNTAQNYTVRFGDNGSVHCVWIGEIDSTWAYPQVIVRDFFGAFVTNIEEYLGTWDISYVTSFTTINNTLTNNFPLSSGGTDDAYWTGSGNNIYNDNSGNVGIGTSSPNEKLHVAGNIHAYDTSADRGLFASTAAGSTTIAIRSNGITHFNGGYVLINRTSSVTNQALQVEGFIDITNIVSSALRWYDGTTFMGGLGLDSWATGGSASNITMYCEGAFGIVTGAGNTKKLVMDTSGNVGIGTTSPSTGFSGSATPVLEVSGTKPAIQVTETDVANSYIYMGSSGGSSYIGMLGTALHFQVGATTNSNKMTILADGKVGISKTPTTTYDSTLQIQPYDSASNVLELNQTATTNRYFAIFTNPNGAIGSIQGSGTTTSYGTSSDYRLKENVVEMTGALDRVNQLKPSRFNFISDADKTLDGFLAHEVQDIVPEAITGEKDATDNNGNPQYQQIDQSKLVPLLVGAIQELEARVKELENK